jgi:hypothetical protein
MTVLRMLNLTIVRSSQRRTIDPRQTVPSRTDRKLAVLNQIGPRRIGRRNRPRVMTAQLMPNLTIVRTNQPRATGQRRTVPNQTDQNPIDLWLGLKRPSLHDRRRAMTVRPTQNPTIVRTSQRRAIGQRRTALRIDPMRRPLELRNVNNRSHKHPKRKSARMSSARRSHSLPNKRLT